MQKQFKMLDAKYKISFVLNDGTELGGETVF